MADKRVDQPTTAAAINVTSGAISSYATGRYYPRAPVLGALERFLGISLADDEDEAANVASQVKAKSLKALDIIEVLEEARQLVASRCNVSVSDVDVAIRRNS